GPRLYEHLASPPLECPARLDADPRPDHRAAELPVSPRRPGDDRRTGGLRVEFTRVRAAVAARTVPAPRRAAAHVAQPRGHDGAAHAAATWRRERRSRNTVRGPAGRLRHVGGRPDRTAGGCSHVAVSPRAQRLAIAARGFGALHAGDPAADRSHARIGSVRASHLRGIATAVLARGARGMTEASLGRGSAAGLLA